MKLNFKEDTLSRYSFRELEYGLSMLNKKITSLKLKCFEYVKQERKRGNLGGWGFNRDLDKLFFEPIAKLEIKVALVEDDMANRMLTGQDDGMLERVLLEVE